MKRALFVVILGGLLLVALGACNSGYSADLPRFISGLAAEAALDDL
jgi:hypothetical protein